MLFVQIIPQNNYSTENGIGYKEELAFNNRNDLRKRLEERYSDHAKCCTTDITLISSMLCERMYSTGLQQLLKFTSPMLCSH